MNHMRLTLALAVVIVTVCAASVHGSPITANSLLDPLSALGNTAQPTWERYTGIGAAGEESQANARIAEQYGKLPLSFVQNRGQLDSAVRYVIRGPQASAFFTESGVTFDLSEPLPKDAETRHPLFRDFGYTQSGKPNQSSIRSGEPGIVHNQNPETTDLTLFRDFGYAQAGKSNHSSIRSGEPEIVHGQNPETTTRKCAALRMEFEGADPNCRVEGIDELPGKVNYFTGSDSSKWHTDIPTFKGVIYRGVWPGVDVSYHGDRRQLKYDIRVAPGADLSKIRLRYEGAENLWLDDSGDLHVQTAVTTFVEKVPGIYQENGSGKQALRGGYVLLDDHTVGFRVEGRNPDLPLVIDPASDLVYSTLLGGSGQTQGCVMAIDSSGCAYVAATTFGNFPTTPGAFRSIGRAIYIMKLNETGSEIVYCTGLGNSFNDGASSIATDSSGCVYVAGSTDSPDFPTTSGAFQTALNGSRDAFVTKLNATGSALVYSTFLSGSNDDWAFSIAIDSSGRAYVAGRTYSSDFPTTPGAFQRTHGGYYDAFVTKLNSTGSALVYSTFLGGNNWDEPRSISVDSSGCAYVAGETLSLNFPTTPGAFQTTYSGGDQYRGDAFVTKLNTTGSALVYSTYLGGSNGDKAWSIVADSSGCAYVAGETLSLNFPTTPGAFQSTYGGGYCDAFVTKLNTTGSALVYSTYLGGSNGDRAWSIVADSSGCAYVAGGDSSGCAYVAGGGSSGFPTTTGAFRRSDYWSWDNFVTKLAMSPGGATVGLSLSAVTAGQAITVTVYAPGATSVTLSFSGGGVTLPTLSMTSSGGDTWTRTFATSFLSACRGSSVKVRATAYLAAGGTATGSATLWKGSGPPGPLPPGSQLNIFSDDTGAYGLASSSYQIWNPGGNPLNAELLVNQDLDMWFGLDVRCSGTAYWSTPTGYSVPELMGKVMLVNPGGSIAEIGHFRNQGDSITMSLNFNSNYAPVVNIAQVLLHLIPGGSIDPGSVVQGLQDFQHIKAVSDAALKLFGSRHSSTWEWTKAAGSALWSLKSLVSDSAQRAALASAFSKIGLQVGESNLKFILQGAGAYDLLKFIASDNTYLVQTRGDTIDCTFQAYGTSGSGNAPQAIQSMSGTPTTNDIPPPAQTSVTWQAVPSATDWLISYNVSNQGTSPVWSHTVFYEPSVGAPTAILEPPGWSHTLDTDAGTVTWYTEGPGGWVNGDFGTAAIAPGISLAGFGVRHTAPPDYAMCSSTDTGYGTCFGQVAAPAPAQGIWAAKMRTANDEVWLSDKIVTAVFPDGSYYVEDPERICGIKVTGSPAPSVGDKVRIVGALAIANGEAQVNATTCLIVGTGTIRPLGMPARSLGGGSALGLQQGITGASGLNNIGLLVKVYGRVTASGTDPRAGIAWFYVDDGSNVQDGTGITGVYCEAQYGMAPPAVDYYVSAEGISGCEFYNDNLVNVLRIDSQDDIKTIFAYNTTIMRAAVSGDGIRPRDAAKP